MRKSNDSRRPAGPVAVLDIETIVPKARPDDGSFPKWPLHRPLVASLLTAQPVGDGQWQFALHNLVIGDGGEAQLCDQLDALLPEHGTLVTANGRGFDLPLLALRAMTARSFGLAKLSRYARATRFDLGHSDICELFSNHGGAPRPSLAEICSALQIPVKVETHGSEAAELAAAGEIDRIMRYCASDVAATYVAWLHYAAWHGGDDAIMAEPLAAFGRWIEDDPDLSHLTTVARCPPAQWASSRAAQLAFASIRAEAERRMERERTAAAFGARDIIGHINDLPEPDPGF